MPWGTTPGIQTPWASVNANTIPFDVFRMAIDYFPNRCPLVARLAKKPLNALTFYLNSDTYRPYTATLNAAYTSAGTTLTLLDTTGLSVGDVLEIDSERLLVTNVNNATTVTVTGAFEGTTQANHANTTSVALITNARTGAEVDQNAISRLPSTVAQYAQTVQFPYQVGGSFQSTGNYMSGEITPEDRDRLMAVQHTMDAFERACYFGKGSALSATVSNQTMKGFKTLLTTNNNLSPTNATTYKPSDFTRDVLQTCFNSGGQPDTVLVSTGFLNGLSTWGWLQQRVEVTETKLGIKTSTYFVPFLGGVELIPAPLLTGTTAIAFNRNEVSLRIKRPLFEKQRGSRGDAFEGDMIMEGSLEVENESHQSYTSGIVTFAVQS